MIRSQPFSVNSAVCSATSLPGPRALRFRPPSPAYSPRCKLTPAQVAELEEVLADLGAWLCFEDESGQGLRPPKGRTWGRRGRTPVVTVTGGHDTRVSLGAYVTAKCRCPGCMQWSADYGRSCKRQATGRAEREWSAALRRDPTEYMGKHTWYRIWNSAVEEADLPFRYTPYQVRHTHASWLIDQGVDLERVRHRLGHGDLTTTTRYVKILDEEDSTAADVMGELLKAVG